MATLQQLCEDRAPSDRGCEDRSENGTVSNLQMSLDSCSIFEGEVSRNTGGELFGSRDEDDTEDEDESEDEGDCGEEEEEPEWMSFSTPDGANHISNFEEFWSEEPETAMPVELTSEAIWRLVQDRAQQEIARALEEAERSRIHCAPRAIPLRRGQAPPSRRPRRGERGELVAELARQGAAAASSRAQHSELLRPVAQRLGKGVARAGSAMQDAGRLAREAGAVVASRAQGHAACGPPPEAKVRTLMPEPEVCRSKQLAFEADARNAKSKVVDAANAVKTKLLHKMPKGLRRRGSDE